MSRSTIEVKYRCLANAAAELTWYRLLLDEIGIKVSGVPTIWCYNTGAVSLAANHVLHARVEHVELDMHFVKEKVLHRELQVNHVPKCDQITDVFTKPLTVGAFTCCQDCLAVTVVSSFVKTLQVECLVEHLRSSYVVIKIC